MSRKKENTKFICESCGQTVEPLSNGSYRNHCPYCLYSKHLDIKPGDRSSLCHGLMAPIGRRLHSKKGMQIAHQCEKCGHTIFNKIAEDMYQSDSIDTLIQLEVV